MEIREQLLTGCYVVETFRCNDGRGSFCKPYSRAAAGALQGFSCAEFFYSLSKRDVVRGMHIQVGPAMLDKLVLCMGGAILDVLVDLRAGDDFGKVASIDLSGASSEAILVPKGVAHGFLTLSDESLVGYLTSHAHVPDLDIGVHWRSIDFDWPIYHPIMSPRDAHLPPIAAFQPIKTEPAHQG